MGARPQPDARRAILIILLAALGAAAVTGLIILFVGAGDVAGRVLGSILVIAAGALIAMPGELVRSAPVRVVLWALVAIDVVLVWVVIWWGDSPPIGLVKVVGTLSALVAFVAVSIAVLRAASSHPTRWARACLWVGMVSGVILLVMAWLMIWTDGDIGIPERLIAGTGIIYAASSLASALIAFLGGYRIVRREPGRR